MLLPHVEMQSKPILEQLQELEGCGRFLARRWALACCSLCCRRALCCSMFIDGTWVWGMGGMPWSSPGADTGVSLSISTLKPSSPIESFAPRLPWRLPCTPFSNNSLFFLAISTISLAFFAAIDASCTACSSLSSSYSGSSSLSFSPKALSCTPSSRPTVPSSSLALYNLNLIPMLFMIYKLHLISR